MNSDIASDYPSQNDNGQTNLYKLQGMWCYQCYLMLFRCADTVLVVHSAGANLSAPKWCVSVKDKHSRTHDTSHSNKVVIHFLHVKLEHFIHHLRPNRNEWRCCETRNEAEQLVLSFCSVSCKSLLIPRLWNMLLDIHSQCSQKESNIWCSITYNTSPMR